MKKLCFLPFDSNIDQFVKSDAIVVQSIIQTFMLKNNKAKKPAQQKVPTKEASKPESKQSQLQKLVKANSNFEFIENGKIKCVLTGHEFAPTLQNFEAYLKSKSYKKGIQGQFDISQYEDFLVPFKANNHFLFCRLTGVKIPKKKTAIERHVKSKKFQFRMQKVLAENQGEQGQEKQLELVEQAEQDNEEQSEEGEEEEQEDIQESVEEQKAKPTNGKKQKKPVKEQKAKPSNGKKQKKGKK